MNEKALLLPIAIPSNPHQRQLTAALDRLGVKVAFANPASARPLLSTVADHAPVGIRRLHWTHRLTTADDRLRSVRAVRFTMERAP